MTPLLLSPAGSPEALTAAISGGADEVYFGAKSFNARYGAQNFDDREFSEALKLCRLYKVKSNITVNTLLSDRELNDAINFIYFAASNGADYFIIQDLALAAYVRKLMPELNLHASTQAACHNIDGAKKLSEYGFSRIVLARELPLSEIKKIADNGKDKFETEIFVHGALCVCHSGQCLMSSVIGGRSGNRGMCAQPCRMEYSLDRSNKGFPLSLKDLSLSEHIPELLSSGVCAFKIEGRMKSPEYVYKVTEIWKRLLCEKRNANSDEVRELSVLFSRNGFTDSYFSGEIIKSNRSMYGYRSEKDKENTRISEKNISFALPKIKISAECEIESGEKPSLLLFSEDKKVCFALDTPCSEAKSSPIDSDFVIKGLTKLGDTHFSLSEDDIKLTLGENVFLASSQLNALRRGAAELLEKELSDKTDYTEKREGFPKKAPAFKNREKNPKYRYYMQEFTLSEMPDETESIFFPLWLFKALSQSDKCFLSSLPFDFGVIMPRVFFDSEREGINNALSCAKKNGAKYIEVSNIGHITVAQESGLLLCGGIGLNIYNSEALKIYAGESFYSLMLSPELKIAQMRDTVKPENIEISAFVKGRLPLMVLESCVIRANGKCKNNSGTGYCGELADRIGASFPLIPQPRFDSDFPCRNILLNSEEKDLTGKSELYNSGIDIFCVYC